MSSVRKKQDDKILKSLRELANLAKHCFDCGAKGVTYVDMTIGSFVCTTCSGILRGLTPPHRVKSISMATFTTDEVEFLRAHGNEECAKTWLGLWDAKRALKMDHKDFMVEKYERKRYYLEPASPLKSIPSTTQALSASSLTSSSSAATMASTKHSSSSSSSTSSSRSATLDFKGVTLTPPTPQHQQNGHHHHHHHHHHQHNNKQRHFPEPFTNEDNGVVFKHCKPPAQHNGDTNNKNGQIADFTPDSGKVSWFEELKGGNNNNNNNNNGLVNGSNNGVMENFADFEHNQIYNAAGLSLNNNNNNNSNNKLATNGLVNGNKSAPSADKYAALKDLDEQFREIKIIGKPDLNTNTQSTANPFKSNPFQGTNSSPWNSTIEPVTISPPKPATTNGWTNGFTTQHYNNSNNNNNNNNGMFGSPVTTNGFPYMMMPQQQPQQNGIGVFGGGLNQPNGNFNPFMTGTVNSNNPFL